MKLITKHSDGSATVARTDGKVIRLTVGQVKRYLPAAKTKKS
jgi:hypothetical protein